MIPLKKLREFYGDLPATILPEEYERRKWWEGVTPPCKEQINRLLPPTTCWSDQIDMWGSEDGNRIMLIYSSDRELEEIALRVDLRPESIDIRHFIVELVRFAKDNDYAFLNDNGKVLIPECDLLAKDLQMSDAQEFVNAPLDFLRRNAREIRDEE